MFGAAMKALWATPAFRNKMLKSKRAPEARALMSEARRTEWDDPEVRAKRISGSKRRISANVKTITLTRSPTFTTHMNFSTPLGRFVLKVEVGHQKVRRAALLKDLFAALSAGIGAKDYRH